MGSGRTPVTMLRTLTEEFALSKRTVLVGVRVTLTGASKISSLKLGLFH